MVGKTLGHYEILEPLGKGGMGEVYRARDTTLKRDVAIKVLPEELSADPDRLARLEREAKLLAALNHPNIATIHGLEEEEGARFLVLELVKGASLERLLAKGRLSVEKALDVCKQIAEALEAAHKEGIIHRDLKPANVLITPDGRAKVLDFGIAKSMGLGDDVVSDTAKATNLTVAGTLVGTPAYMSPEQIRGEEIDKRADIWAFGCVLYETLTGRSAFARETMADTLAAIVDQDPDWSALPDQVPGQLRHLIKRCLRKNPDLRLHDVADARIEIIDAINDPEGGWLGVAPVVAQSPMWRRATPWILAALGVGALGLSLWRTPLSRGPVRHLGIALPAAEQLNTAVEREAHSTMVLSPDGSTLVYVSLPKDGNHPADSRLYLRRLDEPWARPIADTEGGWGPFYSPDGQYVGFFAEAKLKKVPVSGGGATVICDAPNPWGASWGADGTIILVPNPSGGLFRVSADGGTPEPLTTVDTKEGEQEHDFPQMLPDGKSVLFTIWRGGSFSDASIAVASLDTGEHKIVQEGGGHARYVPSGHLVYARSGELLAVPFDLAALEATATPVPVATDILTLPLAGPQFEVSPSGVLVYAPGGLVAREGQLVWIDRNGELTLISDELIPGDNPRLSPDDRQVAFRTREWDIWTYDLARGTRTRVTTDPGWDEAPIWTPDNKRITFSSARNGVLNLFSKAADGSGGAEELLAPGKSRKALSWSPDGRILAYREQHESRRNDIWLLPIDGDQPPQPFLVTEFDEWAAKFSPDGRWIAYQSNESGRYEIYVKPYPDTGERWPISAGGGVGPIWAQDGTELYYAEGNKTMAVFIDTEPEFAAGTPEILHETGTAIFAVTRTQQRFLGIQYGEFPPVTRINVVLNWFEELKRLVPTGGSQ